jgi:hypothetical protein
LVQTASTVRNLPIDHQIRKAAPLHPGYVSALTVCAPGPRHP